MPRRALPLVSGALSALHGVSHFPSCGSRGRPPVVPSAASPGSRRGGKPRTYPPRGCVPSAVNVTTPIVGPFMAMGWAEPADSRRITRLRRALEHTRQVSCQRDPPAPRADKRCYGSLTRVSVTELAEGCAERRYCRAVRWFPEPYPFPKVGKGE